MSTAAEAPSPLRRERALILGTLILLTAAGWAVVAWEVRGMDGGMGMSMGLTMDMSVPLFLAMWVAMMVGMMFPAAAPMILAFARVHANKRARGRPFVPTWVFAGAYMVIWSAAGVVAFGFAEGAQAIGERSMWLMDNAARIGGGLLVLAGIYQLTPLKNMCLSKCRTPMSFIMTSWRDGWWGSVRMGLEHGMYCLGCCWMLFVILLPLGVMNIAAMVLIAVLIFAEKALPIGRQAAIAGAVVLIAWGSLAVLVPSTLPTTV